MTSDFLTHIFRFAKEIVFLYPFAMSWIWMVGGLLFYILRERQRSGPDNQPELAYTPKVSILIPCHNEEEQIDETIAALEKTDYPGEWEAIAINDGSRDSTAEKLNLLSKKYSFLRVVHLAENKGKALALRTGALLADGKYLICIDGDALLEPNAVAWLASRLQMRPQIGGVTGNPRIRNRRTLLGKLQVGEFTTIIGLIKRTQMNYGKIFTMAGVIAAFRKRALHDVGYWSPDMVTDDIDVTWKLQRAGWYVLYEPTAVCWILMPETLRGLWNQRLRWAQGSAEAAMKYGFSFFTKRGRRMLPILIEYGMSIIWAHCVIITIIFSLIEIVFGYSGQTGLEDIVPSHWAVLLGMTFMLQSLVSMILEYRYEPRVFQYYFWMIWYPMAYWAIMAVTAVVGLYKAIFTGRKKLATWVSPDRGVR
ncbi:poly-beta-1,6-N-acetyl-D-glucosamine synthase [Desulforhopalus sp. 52FAK]